MNIRKSRAALAGIAACAALGGVTLGTQAAEAQTPLPLIPTLDCVVTSSSGLMTAYFGYTNTGPDSITIPIGDNNGISPGEVDAGQPVTFDVGAYPKVFAVSFSPATFPVVTWELNGLLASASATSPQCAPGITAPASGVTATAATLNGVVTPGGTDTTYTFEYGTSPSYGNSTAVTDAGSGDAAELVQAALTGLQPSTTYYYRLDTTAGGVTSDGAQQTFTTLAPAAPAGMTLATTALPAGTADTAYTATLSATGGTPPYTWSVTAGSLPRGLRLNKATGVISGKPVRAGTATFSITVTDSGTPVRESLSAPFAITIAK